MTGVDRWSNTRKDCLAEKSPKVTVMVIAPCGIMFLPSALTNLVVVIGLISDFQA